MIVGSLAKPIVPTSWKRTRNAIALLLRPDFTLVVSELVAYIEIRSLGERL